MSPSGGARRVYYMVLEEKQRSKLKYYILRCSRILGMRMNNEVLSENGHFVVSQL